MPQTTPSPPLVEMALQNPQSYPLPARYLTFGQEFVPGQVPLTANLSATMNGITEPVQVNVLATNPDGSVRMADLTLLQPALPPNSTLPLNLSLAPAPPPGPALNVSDLASGVLNLEVNLGIHPWIHQPSYTLPYHLNVASLLANATAAGNVSYWFNGPLSAEARIDLHIYSSLHVTMDLTLYAGGSSVTDVEFNNNDAMQPFGGIVNYSVAIVENGTTVFQNSSVEQFQYTSWHWLVYSAGYPAVNIVHNISYLEATGAIQQFDLADARANLPTLQAQVASEGATMGGPGFGILGSDGVTMYMPMTGGRPSIGPQTQANALWLFTQNSTAATYALDQANASGSVPWSYYDPVNHTYLDSWDWPLLWEDPRGGSNPSTWGLTQPPNSSSGWTYDSAHQPDLTYVPYLLTGSRYYLDLLNAQATAGIMGEWPVPGCRNDASGIVTNACNQVRSSAWNLRQVEEAAYINPNHDPLKAYLVAMVNNSYQLLLNDSALESPLQGEAQGWIQGVYGWTGGIPMWQEDFVATSTVLGTQMGVPAAASLLSWQSNLLVGRYLATRYGFCPEDGDAYALALYNDTGPGGSSNETDAYPTWLDVVNASVLEGMYGNWRYAAEHGNCTWPVSWVQGLGGQYTSASIDVLSGIISTLRDPRAMLALAWLLSNASADQAALSDILQYPQFLMMPRLPDGKMLTYSQVFLSNGSTPVVFRGSGPPSADELLYSLTGNHTVVGNGGTDILVAGVGNQTLLGGPGNDYLFGGGWFGGNGTDLLYGGNGTNYLQAGYFPTTFQFRTPDRAQDTVAGFGPEDRLSVLDGAGQALGVCAIQSILDGASSDTQGNAVLSLGPDQNITLLGIPRSELSLAMFDLGGSGGCGSFPVTFTVAGLPSGAEWSVGFHGTVNTTNGTTLVFSVANGSYTFSVLPPTGYLARPANGTVVVTGTSVKVPIYLYRAGGARYPLSFSEDGLPSGIPWAVLVNGNRTNSSLPTLVLQLTNGSYDFSVAPPPYEVVSPSNGTVTIAGRALTLTLQFFSAHTSTFPVWFVEEGLPSGTPWSVSLAGSTLNGTGSLIAFSVPNGSYPFRDAAADPGHSLAPPSGTVQVNGTGAEVVLGTPGILPLPKPIGFPADLMAWLVSPYFLILVLAGVVVAVLVGRYIIER